MIDHYGQTVKWPTLMPTVAIPAVTLLALIAVFTLGYPPWPISVLGDIDASRIRQIVPYHLVNPDWIKPKDGDLSMPWIIAEMKARIAVIGIIWAGLIVVIWWSARRQRIKIRGISV